MLNPSALQTRVIHGTNSKSIKEWITGVAFSSPAILGFLIFTLIPMVASLVLSFTDYGVFNTPKFVGLQNYATIFSKKDLFFLQALKATAYYTVLNVPASILFSFTLALLLNNNLKFRGVLRSIYYLPSIVPVLATSMVWLWIFNPDFGLINSILETIGLPKGMWLYSEKTVIPSLVLVSLWGTGQTMVIFLAGLQAVPRQYYEAIEMDGGNAIHKLFKITIPLMSPTIFFNSLLAVINSFQVFTLAYVMTNGGPSNASFFYVFYLYREGFQRSHMGYASALAWILFIIILIFSLILLWSQKKWVYYEGDQ